MKIYDIEIKNFRWIKFLPRLKFGNINTFVWKNDSWKSTILKALDIFFNEKFTQNDIFKWIPPDEKTEIILRFNTGESVNSLALDADWKIQLKKVFYFNNSWKLVKECYYICNDIANDDYDNCWWIKEQAINSYLESLWIEYSRSGRSVTNLSKIELINENTTSFGRIEKIHEADEFIKNLERQYDFIEMPEYLLFDAEQDLSIWSTTFQSQFKPIATQSLENNSTLTRQLEENVQQDLETEFELITELMKKNVPNLEKIKPSLLCNWNNLVKFDLSLKFVADTFEIPIENKWTWFKRLLMVAYFEYLARKNIKKYQIFWIEEPETFLHPELQSDLLESINVLSENSQFFITTHSPIFAWATEKSNIVVVKKINELSEYYNYENETEILDIVIKELWIRPNYNLLNDDYRKVVFVEWSGDVKFWEIAISKITWSYPDDILIIPCWWDQVEFFVNAELCRKINRNFIFILDSDKWALDYESKLRNKESLKEKIHELDWTFEILRKREIENYYSKEAIQRIILWHHTLSASFTINDYDDVKENIKIEIPNSVCSTLKFPAKNNIKIFEEMTKDEWISSWFFIPELNKTDLEDIIEKILS